MRKQLASLLAAVAVTVLASAPARAADITFDLTQLSFNNPSASLTVDGYTLLITSTIGNLQGFAEPGTGGLRVGLNTGSFTIQKTAGESDLVFKSYRIGESESYSGNSRSFNLIGGTGTSNGNGVGQTTEYTYNGNYTLVGSQSVEYSLVNYSFVDFGFILYDTTMFNRLTFTVVPVPEPSTYALGAIATGVLGFVARRRKG